MSVPPSSLADAERHAERCIALHLFLHHPALREDVRKAICDPDGTHRYDRLHAILLHALALEAQGPAGAHHTAQDVAVLRDIIHEHRRFMHVVESEADAAEALHTHFAACGTEYAASAS